MTYDKAAIPPNVRNPEQRLVSEYLVAKFPDRRHATRVALGGTLESAAIAHPPGKALRASRPWRLEADAIVWMDDYLLLIEGKVKELLNGLAKLPLYKALVPETPELEPWWGWEVRMRLVTPRAADSVYTMAASAGIEVDIFEPDWMTAYWEYRDRYWTAEYRKARDQLNDARKSAGL